MTDAVSIIIASYELAYPNAPYEWLEKAAKETLFFTSKPGSGQDSEKILEHLERVKNMCTTGNW
jgi:hypothetical protein